MIVNWIKLFPILRKNEKVDILKKTGKYLAVIILLAALAVPSPLFAADGVKKVKKEKKTRPPRSPKTAMLMAMVPGMGQAYNHKFWKIPFVYAGFGVFGYFALANQKQYTLYGNAYTCKIVDPKCTNPISLKYSEQSLLSIRNYYRRNMQLSYILMGAWYLLQIIDANVDAQLSHWNISNNLSMEVAPMIQPMTSPATSTPLVKGVALRFKF